MQTACKSGSHATMVVSRSGPPLVVVAGFLGAGKTTFLRGLIPKLAARGKRPHVVLNDYHNARIDAELLSELEVAVEPVSGSCVCCGSRDELMETLLGIPVNEHTVVVIEANGTTDTSTLIELLTLDRRSQKYAYPVQVAAVDAKRWGKRMFYDFLEKAQVETASYVSISRQDQVDERRWQKVMGQIMELNPQARAGHPSLVCDCLCEALLCEIPQGATTPAVQAARQTTACLQTEHSHKSHDHNSAGHHQHPGHQAHHFASLELLLPAEMEASRLHTWLESLPPQVLRVKGIALLTGERSGWHVFEMIQGFGEVVFHPLKGQPAVTPRAVLIGPRLPDIKPL